MSSLQRHEISIENIDLSGYVGIDLSKLHIPHNTRVVGDWEALELGDINAYRELVISLLTLFTLFLCFLYNFRIAIHILCARRGLVSVLNFMQSSIGVISSAFGWLRILIPWIISCQLVGYTTAAGLYIGLTSIVGILFIKAYYVNHHSYKVIIIGAICIILSFSVSMGSNWTLVTFQYGRGRCAMAFDYRWIVLKFAVDATSNLLLTICYLHKIWMKDHNKRDMAAKLLFQDGLIYGLCAILTNVAANTIILCVPSLTFWQPHVYGFDYCIISTLVCRLLWHTRIRYLKEKEMEAQRRAKIGRSNIPIESSILMSAYSLSLTPLTDPNALLSSRIDKNTHCGSD